MSKIAIIIPCYNEARRFRADAFGDFLHQEQDYDIVFVNDGSTDDTLRQLQHLRETHTDRITIISFKQNQGKAAAVRTGLQQALQTTDYSHIGYLDADLSTSLQEFHLLVRDLIDHHADYIYGSRIRKLNTVIQRSGFRHAGGRLIATIIDLKFRLGIYDTQCGAKCFSEQIVREITREPFRTRWLFDVEIFLRIRKAFPSAIGIEKPLNEWTDQKNSKITVWDFNIVCREIMTLFKFYRTY